MSGLNENSSKFENYGNMSIFRQKQNRIYKKIRTLQKIEDWATFAVNPQSLNLQSSILKIGQATEKCAKYSSWIKFRSDRKLSDIYHTVKIEKKWDKD